MNSKNILLIGSGRLAHHLRFYLTSKGYGWHSWDRKKDPLLLGELAQTSEVALLAVSDGAIESLARRLPEGMAKIHFSGVIDTKFAAGAHPLMTFGHELFEPSFYDEIPLVIDERARNLVKDLPNPKQVIQPEKKALYHSLCHLAGNFPKLLWEEVFQTLEHETNLPRQHFKLYLEQVLQQVIENKTDLKAGPFGRKDLGTIASHLASLNQRPILRKSYNQFYELYQERNEHELT